MALAEQQVGILDDQKLETSKRIFQVESKKEKEILEGEKEDLWCGQQRGRGKAAPGMWPKEGLGVFAGGIGGWRLRIHRG